MELYPLHSAVTAFTTDRRVGREPALVREALAGIVPDAATLRFVRPHQTHTTRVLPLAEEFFALPEATRQLLLEGVDAVVSQVRHTIIGVSTADCIPVIIYDTRHHAAAAVHAGWRGTVEQIAREAMATMAACYGTDPSDCTAAIGPGISQESFEVGDEVYDAFAQKLPQDIAAIATRHDKWHLDLKEANRRQLTALGVPEDAIIVSPTDTYTNADYFSARREQHGTEKCGRNLTAFVLE